MTMKDKNSILDNHPDHEDLSSVAEGNVSAFIRGSVLEHIDHCESCRFVLTELAKQVDKIPDMDFSDSTDIPLQIEMIDRDIHQKQNESAQENKPRPWRRSGDTLYFWVAGSLGILSLLITRYDAHLLVAGAIFGLLAIVDYSHRNIFDPLVKAWRE
ncbi:MAG: hypothetical protein ABIG42_10345, partial [bacterium]